MKYAVCLFFVMLGFSTFETRAQLPSRDEVSPDIGLVAVFDTPGIGDYDLYTYGLGAELQFRDWVSYPWGYSIALGYSEWATDKNAGSPGSNLYDFDGKLEIVPFGGSVLYHAYAGDSWDVSLDGGIRWLANDSKITARISGQDPENIYDVDVGDAIHMLLGVNADYKLSADILWSVSAGYRTDISRGSLSTELGPARDSIMESFVFTTGLRIRL